MSKTIVHVVMALCMVLIVLESSQVIEFNLAVRAVLAAVALISSCYLLFSYWQGSRSNG